MIKLRIEKIKICIAQTKPIKGNISDNIEAHKKFIVLAYTLNAAVIFFPELSLTSYEPELANDLATNQNDNIFNNFQEISNKNKITIGVGMPTRGISGIQISMIIFQPDKPRLTYSKQQLHSDEFPYFINGEEQIILTIDKKKSHQPSAMKVCKLSIQTMQKNLVLTFI